MDHRYNLRFHREIMARTCSPMEKKTCSSILCKPCKFLANRQVSRNEMDSHEDCCSLYPSPSLHALLPSLSLAAPLLGEQPGGNSRVLGCRRLSCFPIPGQARRCRRSCSSSPAATDPSKIKFLLLLSPNPCREGGTAADKRQNTCQRRRSKSQRRTSSLLHRKRKLAS